jgi:3-phosphoshikimate 1-carboxyvinyltransferase
VDGSGPGGAHPARRPLLIFLALPPAAELKKRVRVPASKSVTNRAMLLAALSPRPFSILGPLECDDADSMRAALSAAGVSFERTPRGWLASAGATPRGEIVLDVRDSGTACRFLAAYAATTSGGEFLLTGSERLRQRPIGGLVEALRGLGAQIVYAGEEGAPPLRIRGRALSGGEVAVEAGQSSQFASALLLVSTRLPGGLRLRLEGPPVSEAYLAATVEALSSVGIEVRQSEREFEIGPGAGFRRFEVEIPGDYSSALPLAAAAAVAGGQIDLEGLEWPSTQADAGAFRVLEEMGCSVAARSDSVRVSGRAVRPTAASATGFPDAVPALCAVAAHVGGESVFSGVEHLKIKESDRIAAILDLLAAAGRTGRYESGALRVFGGPPARLAPPVLPTRGDHRIVMAAALLSLRRGGLVENPRAVGKSYPGFLDDLYR